MILKYVSFLSLKGFERVPPVTTGSVGDTEVCVGARACQQGSDNSILVLRDCHNDSSVLMTGTGIAQWLARRTRDRKVAGSNPLQERRENVLLQGRLSVLTLISVSVPPPCYFRST